MKIAIIGTGGVGGYFGARLVRAGFDVVFLARGEQLQAIRNHGLVIKSISGDFEVHNLRASDKFSDLGQPDLLILCVKAWQIKEIRHELSQILSSSSLILPLQNGILAGQELSEVIAPKNILGGLCRIISNVESPGLIVHSGVMPEIVFGETDPSQAGKTEEIRRIFEKSGIAARISRDIEADVWKKFIGICVSGLLAVTGTNYGELRSMNETRSLMTGVLAEVQALALKAGIRIDPEFVNRAVAFIDTFPPDSTSSLTRDVRNGRPSEIEYQNGAVAKLGEKYGVPVPLNRFIYYCILPSERKARGLNKADNPG